MLRIMRRPPVLWVVLFFASATLASAGEPKLDAITLQKIKDATVHLQIKLIDGSVAEGSGFFCEGSGVILTNAHVLGMLAADSRRPLEVSVVIRSGQTNSQTLTAAILAVDRNSDLAALRVEGKKLPVPLQLGDSKDLRETQDVYVFGFPFGAKLGKNITVSKTSISSLRKDKNQLKQIQVNGGMHPGNSGGPVTNAGGQVVGVAVSGLKNTQIHFAIPTDGVQRFLSGRSSINLVTGHRFKDGDEIKLPVRADLIDPLGRNAKVAAEIWTGNAGPTRVGTGTNVPTEVAGDSAKKTVLLAYDATAGFAEGDVVLPALKDVKQVYWVRLVITDAKGEVRYFNAINRPSGGFVAERKPVNLKYQPKLGGQMMVEMTSNSQLKLRTPDGDEQTIKCNLTAKFREQAAKKRETDKLAFKLGFDSFNFGVFIDDQVVPGNEKIKKALGDLGRIAINVQMDADGGQASGAADLSQLPKASLAVLGDLTEQVMPSLELMTVGLPGPMLSPLQTWKTKREVEVGPLGFAIPAHADLTYTYWGLRVRDGKQEAIVRVEGSLRGPKGAENRVAGKMSGNIHLSTETAQVVDGGLNLRLDCDLKVKAAILKANGTLFVSLKRNSVVTKN